LVEGRSRREESAATQNAPLAVLVEQNSVAAGRSRRSARSPHFVRSPISGRKGSTSH